MKRAPGKFFPAILFLCAFALGFGAPSGAHAKVVYVDGAIDPPGIGGTWFTAFKTIKEAIDHPLTYDGDEIWVKSGTYPLAAQYDNTIFVNKKVKIYGGFPSSKVAPAWADRDWRANVTTVDGMNRAWSCFVVQADAVIDGFTITRGTTSSGYGGAGINIQNSSPLISNCIITGNQPTGGGTGGGIQIQGYSASISPVISNCLISNNTAQQGGAIWVSGSPTTAKFINCTITGNRTTNSSADYAGTVIVSYSKATFTNCILWGNTKDNASGKEIIVQGAPTYSATVTYSDVQGGFAGTGNKNQDPQFVSILDPHLDSYSPCVDSGNDAALPPDVSDLDGDGNRTEPVPYDADRTARVYMVYENRVDMGCFEYGPRMALTVVTVRDTFTEGEGPLDQAAVMLSQASGTDLVVSLESSDAVEVTVPQSVTIPAGQTTRTFILTVLDDNRIDGPMSVTISAWAQGAIPGSKTIQVLDNEQKKLALTVPASVGEAAGVVSGARVALSGTYPTDVAVSLSVSHNTEIQVPATVTIPAGSLYAIFDIAVTDDAVVDGNKSVSVSASSAGWTNAYANVLIVDNEVPPVTYGLSIAVSGSGATDPAAGSHTYNEGTVVSITALPATGWFFAGWTGALSGTANPASITMTGPTSVTATFALAPVQYNLTVQTEGSGTVTLVPPGGTYNAGTLVHLEASPGGGDVFEEWQGGVTNVYDAKTTITMDAAKTVKAVFRTDGDGDGKSDRSEQGPAGAEPGYDGNRDGIADSAQGSVASLHSDDRQNYVTLAVSAPATLGGCAAVGNPSPGNAPSGIAFPLGFYEFTIHGVAQGGATAVTLYPPAGTTYVAYYKYGPTPGTVSPHWYEFLYDGETGAEFKDNAIVLHFVDGKRGDDDLLANGVVTDQGGPGTPAQASEASSKWVGCFIATAAFGSAMDPHVATLREFRDKVLLVTPAGKALVGLYYAVSPPIAGWISRHEGARSVVRWSLLPVVGICYAVLHFGFVAAASALALVLLLIPLAFVRRGGRGR